VSPRYFETLGTRLLRGRAIDDRDNASAPQVAVVNEAFAGRLLGGDDPIGKRFSIGDGGVPGAIEIVGLVQNAKYDDLRDEIAPMAFLPLLQGQADDDADSTVTHFIRAVEVRTSGEPALLAATVRQTLAAVDPNLPVFGVATLSDHVDRALGGEQVVATLSGFFGAVALVLTAIGLYGLTAYSVQRRTREIGLRVALGADRGSVVAMIVREVLRRAAVGALIGVPAAFVALRLIRSALYGISPADPWSSAGAAVLLLVCMLAAGYVPARRASRIEPVEALRHE
jgi:predicted permease